MIAPSTSRIGVPSWLIALCFCTAVLIGCVIASRELHHWFIAPVFVCGLLVGPSAVDWLRGRVARFDPAGIVGLFGVHFFFLAPLLHVLLDEWPRYIVHPPDWREWLGMMACLNVVALVAYFAGLRIVGSRMPPRKAYRWRLHLNVFIPLLTAALLLSLLLQLAVYAHFGGIQGYIDKFSSQMTESFAGWGFAFMFSESFPILASIAFAVYAQHNPRAKGRTVVILVLLAVLVLNIFFGGLRGSRANYVWPLFWTVGLIHLCVRPVSTRFMLAGVACLVGFMYAYGFYKSYGSDAWLALRDPAVRHRMASESQRGLESTVLHDLGRSDMQAFLLYRLWASDSGSNYEYTWGRSYLGAAAMLIPSRLWPDRPPTKVLEGTEAVWGKSVYTRRNYAQFAYGLAGETMLNFGPLAVPAAYGFFGILVGGLRRWSSGISPHDSRILLLPFAVSLALFFLVWDTDVTLYYVITTGLVPIILIALSSSRSKVVLSRAPAVQPAEMPSGAAPTSMAC